MENKGRNRKTARQAEKITFADYYNRKNKSKVRKNIIFSIILQEFAKSGVFAVAFF
ncbi:MAG: hypothetical protein IJX31_01000 [Clostridia bacterium]|nr:hypothetical protein [Clostridia bacterium]